MSSNGKSMKFIEMTGKTLSEVIGEGELHTPDLSEAGVGDSSIVRVNEHGDIEVRKANKWAIIGGLLGDFAERIKDKTGLDWA